MFPRVVRAMVVPILWPFVLVFWHSWQQTPPRINQCENDYFAYIISVSLTLFFVFWQLITIVVRNFGQSPCSFWPFNRIHRRSCKNPLNFAESFSSQDCANALFKTSAAWHRRRTRVVFSGPKRFLFVLFAGSMSSPWHCMSPTQTSVPGLAPAMNSPPPINGSGDQQRPMSLKDCLVRSVSLFPFLLEPQPECEKLRLKPWAAQCGTEFRRRPELNFADVRRTRCLQCPAAV